jgi:hypothetical protein
VEAHLWRVIRIPVQEEPMSTPVREERMTLDEARSTLRLFLETKPVRGRYTLYEVERRAIVTLLVSSEVDRG